MGSDSTEKAAWFTKVCIWVAVRLACFRARAQRSGARTRNRERREAEYEYENDSYVESCNPELNQAEKGDGGGVCHTLRARRASRADGRHRRFFSCSQGFFILPAAHRERSASESGDAFFFRLRQHSLAYRRIAMSKDTTVVLQLAFPAGSGILIFASGGRLDLPIGWAIIGTLAAFGLAVSIFADPDMMRERLAPGPGNRDLLTRRLSGVLLIAHWVLVGIDVSPLRFSQVPWGVQVAGLVGFAAALSFLLRAMWANPFYSFVVRVQTERGHQVVAKGPYRFVRHPGYAATLFGMLSGGVALGSWLAMLPILMVCGLFIRRTLLEDRLLQQELEGYLDFAQKVRYRLVVGLF